MEMGLSTAEGYISLSHRSCTLTPSSHPEFTFSIWPRPPVLTHVSEGRLNMQLCVVATPLIDVLQYVAESLTVMFPRDTQASSISEVKGSCHSPQHQLEKPQQCVKSVSSESLGGEEEKKRRHCNGTLPCLPVCLSVCLSARTSESINSSQNAQFLLTCSPPFISGENKHGLWVLSRSVFFRASIVFVFAAFQPATLGNVHSVLPGTWRNSLVVMRLPLHCKINGSLQIPSQGSSLTDVQESGGVRTGEICHRV